VRRRRRRRRTDYRYSLLNFIDYSWLGCASKMF
jgi:hypothetical protein